MLITCIEPYIPQISSQASNKYVISGLVTDQEGYHYVSISLASPTGEPHFTPLTDCTVKILDDKGNTFSLEEFLEGNYRVWIDSQHLTPGTSYMLKVITSAGVEIISDFDQMPICPGIDSVYYIREDLPTTNPQVNVNGIQFYVNTDATNIDSHFFMWELEETWEYHVPYAKEWYFDGEVHRINPPDSSEMVCWSTKAIKNIYTLSTRNLSQNIYTMLPLHFVDNTTSRLMYGYSLLVKQYALTESAYAYWEQLRINSNEQGGLYTKQPLAIRGNLSSVNHPDLQVLGFFSASSVKSKRYFIRNVDDLDVENIIFCSPQSYRFGFRDVEEREYPAYFIEVQGEILFMQESCVDCRTLGGVTTKPDYWPY